MPTTAANSSYVYAFFPLSMAGFALLTCGDLLEELGDGERKKAADRDQLLERERNLTAEAFSQGNRPHVGGFCYNSDVVAVVTDGFGDLLADHLVRGS
jgi:hypothetical protein